MELTFDYEDIKEVFEKMNISIYDVYFGSHAITVDIIETYMYWITPANAFNFYQDSPMESVSLQIKGKWFAIDEIDCDELIGREARDWLKTQKYVNCRYYIDGSGTGTIGSLDGNYSG